MKQKSSQVNVKIDPRCGYYDTLFKPGTLLNSARSVKRLLGLPCGCDLWFEGFSLSCIFFSGPPLEFDADELPDVVDSVSAFAVVTLEIMPPLLFVPGHESS